jgi:hypothetical protein
LSEEGTALSETILWADVIDGISAAQHITSCYTALHAHKQHTMHDGILIKHYVLCAAGCNDKLLFSTEELL